MSISFKHAIFLCLGMALFLSEEAAVLIVIVCMVAVFFESRRR